MSKPKLLNDAGVPADGSFDYSRAGDIDPFMPSYTPPEKSGTAHKVHRKLVQAQQLCNAHLEKTGNAPYFVASAEYVDCRDVREQELTGAEEVDEIDVVVYVLSKNMDNQTGAGIRLPQGRIDVAMLHEMLDAAMDYVQRDIKRQPEPTVADASDCVNTEDYPDCPCCAYDEAEGDSVVAEVDEV